MTNLTDFNFNTYTVIDPADLDLLTAEQAAAILQIAPSYVYKLARQGQIKSVRFGRTVRIRRIDLAEFVKSQVK